MLTMRPEDLLDRLEDKPFRPFRIHLSDGSTLEVPEAGMLIIGMSSAVLPSKWGQDEEGRRLAKHWRTVALSHMVQFTDLEEQVNGRTGKRK